MTTTRHVTDGQPFGAPGTRGRLGPDDPPRRAPEPRAHRWMAVLLVLAVGAVVLPTAVGSSVGPADTERVSVASDGTQGNGASISKAISADGRYVVFESKASNLVPGDTNDRFDVFVHDRHTGTTERVSVATDGTQGNATSGKPAISADGRYVAFHSWATNLAPGDTGGTSHIYVRDRVVGTTERVSVATDGTLADEDSFGAAISLDGRVVAFQSDATTLVASANDGTRHVYVHERDTGVTELVSVATDGTPGNWESGTPALSGDGTVVGFYSDATNLVDGTTNGTSDLYVHNRSTGSTDRVSVATDGTEANDWSGGGALSHDGRLVAFMSNASNLVPGDTNGVIDVFVHDTDTGVTERVSVSSSRAQGNNHSTGPTISPDGTMVAWSSTATNLVAGDTNDLEDVFVRRLATGTTVRVSLTAGGDQANGWSRFPSLSHDGRWVAFDSKATNLVPGDTNDVADIFVRDRAVCAPNFSDVPGRHPFCADIAWMVARNITNGFPDGTFRPTGTLTRMAMAAFLWRDAGRPLSTPSPFPSFSDVPTDHPFYMEVEWLASTGITEGFPDGTFRPTGTINRMAMAAFLYRAAGEPAFTPPATASFNDVPTDHAFYAEVEWLASTGITEGFPDDTFRPTNSLTRQAAAAFLQRLSLLP